MNVWTTNLFLLLCIAGRAMANLTNASEFSLFQTQFNKVYSSEQERQNRYLIFTQNLAKIQSHNSKPNVSWTMGIKQFTDMTGRYLAIRLP